MSDTPTSPQLPVPSGIVSSPKEFSDALTMDLTDSEIKQCMSVIIPIKKKWETRFRSKLAPGAISSLDEALEMLSQFADEITHTLAEKCEVLATVDTTPVLEGQPPIIDYQGVLRGHKLAVHGMDHERKEWEVKKATERDEAFLGQKGNTDSTKTKKRAKR